jgi:hypothetical protein
MVQANYEYSFCRKKLAKAKKRRPSQRCMRVGIGDEKTFFD